MNNRQKKLLLSSVIERKSRTVDGSDKLRRWVLSFGKGAEIPRKISDRLVELFDVTAQKDWANCSAKADVAIGDTIIVADVPVTYLLFLEKQLVSLQTLLGKTPTLDAAEDWTYDTAAGVFSVAARFGPT